MITPECRFATGVAGIAFIPPDAPVGRVSVRVFGLRVAAVTEPASTQNEWGMQ